jgi:hypothetical protein
MDGPMTFGEIFLVGVVVVILLVMAEEFLETYDEWRKDIDEDEF